MFDMLCNKNILIPLSSLIITFVALSSSSLWAELSPDNSTEKDRKTYYEVKFFSLKPGHSIGASRFLLEDNKKFEFVIEKEKLADPKGTYHIKGTTFTADAEFSIEKRRMYHYSFSFKGISVMDTYIAGIARLKEFVEENKLTQQIYFLFFASTKSEKGNKKTNPFF
jgi:hypothetical protein